MNLPAIETASSQPITVAGVELAGFIDVVPSTVSDLAAKGRVVRIGPGRYDLKASTRRYCGHLREAAAGRPGTREDLVAEKARLTKAQADSAEMARDERAGRLADVAVFERRWADDCVIFRQVMLSVPDRIGMAIPALSRHDTSVIADVVRDALTRCADEVLALQRQEHAAEEEATKRFHRRKGKA